MQAHTHFAANVPDALRGRETNPFALRLPISKNWNTSAKRLLLVYEFVDTEDLKAGTLLVGPQGNLLPHLLQLSEDYSSEKTPALAAINFDYFRNRHLSGPEALIAENAAVARVREYIAKVKPTDIFVFGQNAAKLLLEIEDEFYLRGRVRKIKGIYWNHTVNISTAYQSAQDDVETDAKIDLANLIGFTSRCLGNTLKRTTVHHIQFDKESARYSLVDTMEKWEKFVAFWSKKSIFSLDLETFGLGRVVNGILTMQIAFSAQRGFIVPISHKDSPFTKAELKRIYSDVRKILSRKIPSGTLDYFILGQNLKFDMTVLRQQLQIQVVHWPLFDCMAGEYLLDENMKANTSRVYGRNKTSYGLDWICSSYGCDFYTENEFGKKDRGNIANIPLTPDVLRYMVADVQLPWLIMQMQKARAEKQIINGVPYTQAFMKMMLWQMSNMIHVQSMMEHRGEHLDIEWLQSLLKKDGPLDKVEHKLEGEFRNFESVRKVNESLLAGSGLQSKSIFGVSNWIFSVTKPKHKIQLFFDTLGLEPTSIGKSGQPAVDKEFQETYKDVPEVAAFKTLAQVGKVRSTYVLGFLKKLQTGDMAVDHCLRASYGFFETVTGRSNSYDPNLQNIIQRGDLAKLIKRSFTAACGTLAVKLDFSAHEVRMWGIESQDGILCNLFVNGRWLRKMYRATGKPVYKALMETIGDIHKINVATFFQTAPANATKEQRDQVKSIVFGAIYGRSARAISVQIKKAEDVIKELMRKFFSRFKKAAAYLESKKKQAVSKGYTVSLIGRVRHLYLQYLGIDQFVAAAERRGANAPIQGISADLGHTAAYLFEQHFEHVCVKFSLSDNKRTKSGTTSFVHDAIKSAIEYKKMLVAIQVLQWCSTVGLCEYYTRLFGVNFLVEPEIEIEIGASDDALSKWDWHEDTLKTIIRKSLENQKGIYPELDIDKAEAEIWSVRNEPVQEYLDKHYPILGEWPKAVHWRKGMKEYDNLQAEIKAWK